MKSVYIFPSYKTSGKGENNYIRFFHLSFINNGYTVHNRCSFLKVAGLIFNINSDVFIFHWIDAFPLFKLASIQIFIFKIYVHILRMLRKKIVWILHNKCPHSGNDKQNVEAFKLMEFMAHYADVVIAHSNEGISYYKSMYMVKYGFKAHCIPHPVYSTEIIPSNKIIWDFIIWGSIIPYKNILPFITFIHNRPFYKDKRILICGKCSDSSYDTMLNEYVKMNSNITYINEFISDETLKEYIASSRCVLFTYSPSTVLCSGALIHSLNFSKLIIAPNVGNFLDIKGAVLCYDTFKDIEFMKIDDNKAVLSAVTAYIENNKWEDFPKKVFECIS
ncbi:hypothetical protein [uncultured Bacteroides sp.]|uniref:hypothetical protein n=1 Tax=uncultured Bacteroides sp. TaxID=162156 RepID=UPI002AA7BF75|nr:hypothetical protein [uncultured Bacteroides sp.]